MKVTILQADSRPNIIQMRLTRVVNKNVCDLLKYEYKFILIDENYRKINDIIIHPASAKINVVNQFLQITDSNILVFLDSDAWVQNPIMLNKMIIDLMKDNTKHGCFSRDPYVKINTYINSGSFILKINEYTKNMYKEIINKMNNNSEYFDTWPYDQYYISNYVFNNKDNFHIFVPDILNTPIGKILRHNWCKNKKMNYDINEILLKKQKNITFDYKEYYDKNTYPNEEVESYGYYFEKIEK